MAQASELRQVASVLQPVMTPIAMTRSNGVNPMRSVFMLVIVPLDEATSDVFTHDLKQVKA